MLLCGKNDQFYCRIWSLYLRPIYFRKRTQLQEMNIFGLEVELLVINFIFVVEAAGRDIKKKHIGDSKVNIGSIASTSSNCKEQNDSKHLFVCLR